MSDAANASADGVDGAKLDRALLAISSVVVLGTIMSILDTTIVNIAINHLSSDFDAPLTTIQWVSTGYLLALATVIPLTGWAADRFGTKRLYMTSLVLFLAGSALSGMAWSAHSLIAFRVLQGLGGGMIMPAGMTILTQAAGPERVGRVMSVVGAPMLIGPILGPVLGGWLVDDVSWRWIFYVNIPIGAVALVMAYRASSSPTDRRPRHRLDVLGLALLSPGLALLVYGLAETGSHGGFDGPKSILPTIAGIALIVALRAACAAHRGAADRRAPVQAPHSRRSPRSRCRCSPPPSSARCCCCRSTTRWRAARRLSQAGLLMIPQGVGAALMMPVGGRVVDRTGAARVVLPGLVCCLLGFAIFTQVGADTSFVLLGVASFVTGLGIGAGDDADDGRRLPDARARRGLARDDRVQHRPARLRRARRRADVGDPRQPAGRPPARRRRTRARAWQAAQSIPPQARAQMAPLVADAFGHTYMWAFAMILLAVDPGAVPAARASRPPPRSPPVGAPGGDAAAVPIEA